MSAPPLRRLEMLADAPDRLEDFLLIHGAEHRVARGARMQDDVVQGEDSRQGPLGVDHRKPTHFSLPHHIERSTDAVFMTDTQGKIVFANPAFEKVYGHSPAEVIGQTPRILKSGLVPLEGYKQFWATLLGKDVVAGEIVNKTKDGRLITIEGSNNPILDEAGKLVGFLAMHRDITERKRTEAVVAKRATELQTVAKVSRAASRDESRPVLTGILVRLEGAPEEPGPSAIGKPARSAPRRRLR